MFFASGQKIVLQQIRAYYRHDCKEAARQSRPEPALCCETLVQRGMTIFAGRVHAYLGESSGPGRDNRREPGTQTKY
jgi:hypothetical protein